jgi:hypothetical protein
VRFEPDSLLQALLRPLAMAAPDANVYTEIMAPDFRFAFALVLLVGVSCVLLLRRRERPGDGPTPTQNARSLSLLVLLLAAFFVPWLATSGNGRYSFVGLLAIGPVCVGLARFVPATRGLRLVLMLGMLAWQAFAIQQSAPWQAWRLAAWRAAPYFHVQLPEEVRRDPATFVTLSAISYSALAPLFHPDARWISLYNAPRPDSDAPDARRTAAFLAAARPDGLRLFAPTVPGMLDAQKLPNAAMVQGLDRQLGGYGLAVAQPRRCRFLPSRTLEEMGLGEKTAEERAQVGFWLCVLARLPPGAPLPPAPRHNAVFAALERQCPRFFPSGGDGPSAVLPGAELRSYLRSEMKAYVQNDGQVWAKYYRSLNAQRLGAAADLLAGRTRIDCGSLRDSAALPWDRTH